MAAKTRIATCACGAISAAADGEPDVVSLCHCLACQRRTGSPFGVGVYFKREAVKLAGAPKAFVREIAGTNRKVTNSFCPNCGGTVYWTADLRPQHIGIALGSFADPSFKRPTRVVWAQHSHPWIAFPSDIPAYPQAAP